MNTKKKESQENYLEAILMISMQKRNVRAIDIVNMLGFTKASVSFAMKALRDEGMIDVTDNIITFTEIGKLRAEAVFHRHELLTKFLMSIGVCENVAREDACKIEHILSEESLKKMKEAIANSEESIENL